MCTNITLKTNQDVHLQARTMDFSFDLEPEMIVIPRNHPLEFTFKDDSLHKHHAFMGLAKNIGTYSMADGINEHGLSAAALYFEGYAHYSEDGLGVDALAPHEYIMWMLASCKSIDDVREEVKKHSISNHKVDFLGVVPPLHWVFQDISGTSIIVEPTLKGIEIHENKVGVLTNSPDYQWHLTNIRNYIGLDPVQVAPRTLYGQKFEPFGQGSGTFGVPGDLTPPSRFIKTLYTKLSTQSVSDEHDLVISATHILNGVDIAKGSVVTNHDTIDYTQYMAFMVSNSQSYYYRQYNDFTTHKFCIHDFDLELESIIKI